MNTLKNIRNQTYVLLCLAFLLYVNTLGHNYVIDDRVVVTHNSLTQKGISAIPAIFSHSYLFGYDGREDESYRPITLTTFAIERTFFNANPTASHLIQVLLYMLCIYLLFKFLQSLFIDKNTWLPFVITLLFLIHPIHTEVIANIKSRDELLSALFLFSSWFYFLKGIDNNNKRAILSAVLFFFLACLSKDSAVAGIIVYPALLYFFREKSIGAALKSSLLLLIPVGIYFSIRTSVLSNVLIEGNIDPVANSLAATHSFSEFLATNCTIFMHYIQLCFAPIHLSWDYSIAEIPSSNWSNLSSILGLILILGLFALGILGLVKRKKVGFGALFFLAMFALTSNFLFLINCPLGERFLFLPVLGLIFCIVFATAQLFEKNKNGAFAFIGIITLLFSVRTIARNSDWKDNLHIYQSGVEVCPNSVKTHFNLGTEYIEEGHNTTIQSEQRDYYQLAKDELLICYKIYPKYQNIYQNLGYVYGELGRLENDSTKALSIFREGEKTVSEANAKYHFKNKSIDENIQFLKQRILIYSKDENEQEETIKELINSTAKKATSLEDYKSLAYYYEKLGKQDSVLNVYQKIITAYPQETVFWREISRVQFQQKDYSTSLASIDKYLLYYPKDWSSQTNKAMLLEINGKTDEALQLYEFVLRNSPNETNAQQLYNNLKGRLK